MSLVGNRPLPIYEAATLTTNEFVERFMAPAGMTGLWQVSGRSDLSWDETVRLDLYYVDHWSMLQDLSILAKTFRAVVGSDPCHGRTRERHELRVLGIEFSHEPSVARPGRVTPRSGGAM